MEPREARYCEVAVPRPVLGTFVYRLPAELRERACPGVRVLVPFGRGKVVGCVAALREEAALPRVRPVLDLLDEEPLLPAPLLALCRWIADYYAAPPGLALRAALPPGLMAESIYRVRLLRQPSAADRRRLPASAASVLERLAAAGRPLRASTLRRGRGPGSIWPALRALERAGVIRVEEEPPKSGGPVLRRRVIRLTKRLPTLTAREAAFGRAVRQREAYEVLEALGGRATTAHMTRRLGFSPSVLEGLVGKGVARLAEERVERDPLAALKDDLEGPAVPLRPTPAQARAIASLREQATLEDPGVALLRGVTGSGKTLVYLEVLASILERGGRSAIVLVPEISLTPQTVARFRSRFGELVAVLHSGLSAGERYDQWRALREGRKRIAIGARSAVFAPVRELGAIVVDEEHDGSYKQSETPRYHARAVATMRARLERCLCILGSATPSLESWWNALEGRYRRYELPERVTRHSLPRVELVDLRTEREGAAGRAAARGREESREPEGAPGAGGRRILSERLRQAISRRLARGEQVILLLNRRGYASFVQCPACGRVWSCARCNVSLTYHRRPRRVVCHHCGYQAAPPETCDECGAVELSFTGIGTEQVERCIGELFPEARVARMDLDTTGAKWAHFEILRRVRKREIDILLGTQMIAKGLDFPDVTLVGVVNADLGLNIPDFRASERTFQLLAQVAGRAGRGAEAGEVLVQTSRPDHFALRAAAGHDFLGFAERELADRREPGYPPHRRLANVVVSGPDEETAADAAGELAEAARTLIRDRGLEGIDVVGPAPCPIDRLRDRWRWHFLLKADTPAVLGAALRYLARRHPGGPAGVRLEIDRDPESLL